MAGNQLQTLDTIFNSRVFRIPDYQRGYAWVDRQLTDFWEDLKRTVEPRNHYTGQLTLEMVPTAGWKRWDEETWLIEGKAYKPYYVVDGQQRITTAIILIKCLLDNVAPGTPIAFTDKPDLVKKYLVQVAGVSRAYLFGYEKDNPSYEYLKTQILEEPSNQYQGTETTYTANLLAARDFFRAKLKGCTHADVESWYRALTQRFLFNVYELESELDVFVVFETMNNRGKPLSRLELLKNRLIFLSTLLPPPTTQNDRDSLRRNINDAWKTTFESLGHEKERTLDDDEFLRAHWIMYFKYSREQSGQFSAFLLEEHFTAEAVDKREVNAVALQEYVTSIQNSVRKWHDLQFPSRADGLPEGTRLCLERLDRLGRGAFEPFIMAALQAPVSQLELIQLLGAAERFVFLVSRLCQRRSDTGDSEFYRLAGQLFRKEVSIATGTQNISEKTDYYFSAERATTELRELFQRGDGFYSWSGLRYFLFEFEQHLREKAGMNASRLDWDAFSKAKKDHVTIEHVYPVSPISGEWPAFEQKSEGERARLRHSLGNLLALSQSRNSKFSNRSFTRKKQDADGVQGYFNGSYSEIVVAQYEEWTPEIVLKRGLEMLAFLENRWNVHLGSHEEKLKLLSLEFLEPEEAI